MERMEMQKMKWEWMDNWGNKYNGTYEGEVNSKQPHGQGKWNSDDGDVIVMGEWKDGRLNGKVVENYWDGDRDEYEAKDGKLNGKWVRHFRDGRLS